MALSKKKAAANGGKAGGGFRPLMLAGGLGLLWFVIGPSGGFEDETSAMTAAALTVARLLVDFVGGWIAVALLRIAVVAARYAIAWSRARTEGELL